MWDMEMEPNITCLLGFGIFFLLYAIPRLWTYSLGGSKNENRPSSTSSEKFGVIGQGLEGAEPRSNSSNLVNDRVIPIDDIGDNPNNGYTKAERISRCKLAAFYRIVDWFGWSEIILNHITLRVEGDEEQFLLNPYGLLYTEITASSLIKVDLKGNVVEAGSTNLGVNVAGFALHSAIHTMRPDIKCIIHHHHPAVVAISTLKCGLLPLCQETAILGHAAYHDYNGVILDAEEKEKILQNLGPTKKLLFLRNHGIVCCGTTVEEAFLMSFLAVKACKTQMHIMPFGLDNVVMMSDEAREKCYQTVHNRGGINSKAVGTMDTTSSTALKQTPIWTYGEQEFEALLRRLDQAGYRTGHIYKQPLLTNKVHGIQPEADENVLWGKDN